MITREAQVRKRDGRVVGFEPERISRAVANAFRAERGIAAGDELDQELRAEIGGVTEAVIARIPESREAVSVEQIQDLVEEQLMRDGHYRVARRYILYREEHKRVRRFSGEPDEESPGLTVRREDGGEEVFEAWRVRRRIEEACRGLEGVDPQMVLDDVLASIYDGISPRHIEQAIVLSARSYIEREPAYSTVSARLLLGRIYREAWGSMPALGHFESAYRDGMEDYLRKGVEAERLDPELLNYDLARISAALQPARDDDFTYLGLQTVYDRYLIQDANSHRIECPQYFWMRVAMGLALREDDRERRAIEFYEMLSSYRVVSATPTLFNSGTLHSQLSSCYLTTVSDDLEGIFKGISDNAKLSKWAGGLGNDWSRIRAIGSLIKGTGGESQGVIPFLKIVNDTAVAVNQCFATGTLVHTGDGVREIQEIQPGDVVLGKSGTYREVIERMDYEQDGPMVEVEVKHSIAPLRVTDGHPFWAIPGVPDEQSVERTLQQLESGRAEPRWVEAGELRRGDYVAQVVPTETVPMEGITEDDVRLYGILLGDGHVTENGLEWGVSGAPDSISIRFVREYLKSRGVHYREHRRNAAYTQVKWSSGRGVVRDSATGRIQGAGEPTLPFSEDDLYNENREKRISRRFAHLPLNQALALVQGLIEADGGISRGKEIYFTNTSRELVEGVRYQLLRLGVPTAGQHRTREQDHSGTRVDGSTITMSGTCVSYDLRIPAIPELASRVGCAPITKRNWLRVGDMIYTRVRSVREYEPTGSVHDLAVEGDESYMTVSALVHNGGKRKGAACAYLETWHLDMDDFLELRKNTGDERRRTHDMNTANWVPDLFMKRVVEGGEWTLFSPNEVPDLHDLYGRAFEERYLEYERLAEEGKLRQHRKVNAFTMWQKMLSMLFETGHPWVTFKDPCNVRSPQDHAGVVHSSNLCTEITLNTSDDETAVCNLCSLNLAAHTTPEGLDEEKLSQTVRVAVRMLDNVIDINFYPTEDAERANLRHRAVGLGLMGFQDALFIQRTPYASEEAIEFADRSMEMISYYAILGSSELAAERGTYSTYEGSKWDRGLLPIDTIDLLEAERGEAVDMDRGARLDWGRVREHIAEHGMRNSNVMAIAPTATISNISGVYQSIEPTYSNLFVKSNLSGEFVVINPYLVADLKERGLWDEDMIEDLKYFDGSVAEIDRIPEELKTLYLTAFEIDSGWLIDAASRRQKWLDQSQSLNLYLATPSGRALHEMYVNAWRKGLKTTYYLRSRGATSVEKSNADINRRGIQPRWMKSASASSRVQSVQSGQSCSTEDEECEACQ